MYKEMGIVDNFETILVNVFAPLFEVTVDPSSHPDLMSYLRWLVNFVERFSLSTLRLINAGLVLRNIMSRTSFLAANNFQ